MLPTISEELRGLAALNNRRSERKPNGNCKESDVRGKEGPLEGPAGKWVETLTGFVLEEGMDSFVYWPVGDHERQTELFAGEVVPGVREAVEAACSGERAAPPFRNSGLHS